MNTLQEFIDLLKSEKDKAQSNTQFHFKEKQREAAFRYSGRADALSFAIEKAELLLNEETVKDLLVCDCSDNFKSIYGKCYRCPI